MWLIAVLAAAEPALTFGRALSRDEKVMDARAAARQPPELVAIGRDGRDGTYRLNQAGFVSAHSQLRPLQWQVMNARAHIGLLPLPYLDLAAVARTGELLPRRPLTDALYACGPEASAPAPILDLTGTKYTAGHRRAPEADAARGDAWTAVVPGLWERRPRMRVVDVVPAAEFRPDAAGVAAAMMEPAFAPWSRIVVEGEGGSRDRAPGAPPEIAGQQIRGDGFDVELSPGSAAWLHASYNLLPGFRCEIDGREAAIHRAHLAFMAVDLPAGARTVRFRYSPPGLVPGIGISLAGLAATLFVVVALRRRRISG